MVKITLIQTSVLEKNSKEKMLFYNWEIHIKTALEIIDSVQFTLHEDFKNPVRIVKKSPFKGVLY